MKVEFSMRHRGNSATARRRVERPTATGRHRARPASAYSRSRAAAIVGLAALVPVTGGWVAAGVIGFDLNGPVSPDDKPGSALPVGTPNDVRSASASVVLSRSPSPSLDAVTRSAQRRPVSAHGGQSPVPDTVSAVPTSPPGKHRGSAEPESAPSHTAAGRHRADTSDDVSKTPQRDGADGQRANRGRKSANESEGDASPGSRDNGRSGEGHDSRHDRGESNGHESRRDHDRQNSQDDAGNDETHQGSHDEQPSTNGNDAERGRGKEQGDDQRRKQARDNGQDGSASSDHESDQGQGHSDGQRQSQGQGHGHED